MLISPKLINAIWYENHPLSLLLAPLSWLYCVIVTTRRFLYRVGLLAVNKLDVPVIVVGNLTAGGTGKTPLVIWLAEYLSSRGYKPGIVSRGYRAGGGKIPQRVSADSKPQEVGDEPVLIARRIRCPVVIGRARHIAARALINQPGCDVIIADDGLQHYGLYRDIQINVIDGRRRFGNRRYLPAGPLRESLSRLNDMDLIVVNGPAGRREHQMDYQVNLLVNLTQPDNKVPLNVFKGRSVHAVAGIGAPAGFFACLRQYELDIIPHVFPDHHYYSRDEINFDDDLAVIMTEKDAVKCGDIGSDRHWYLPVEAKLSETFLHRLNTLIEAMPNGQETA